MKIKTDFITNSSSSSFIVVAVPDWFNTSLEELKKIDRLPTMHLNTFTDKHLKRLTKIINEQTDLLKEGKKIRERDCIDADDLDAYNIIECLLEDFILSYHELDFVENDGFIQGEKIEVVDDLFLSIHRHEFEKVYEVINK